jgi:hypothetical protein
VKFALFAVVVFISGYSSPKIYNIKVDISKCEVMMDFDDSVIEFPLFTPVQKDMYIPARISRSLTGNTPDAGFDFFNYH